MEGLFYKYALIMKLGLFGGNTLHGHNKFVFSNFSLVQMSVAARSKAWVCGCSLAGVAGSNPARGIVCLL
jgi:hypothetical protein